MLYKIKSNLKGIEIEKVILFSGAFISILWSVYFAIVTILIPYQIEFREGTAQVLTKLLLSGLNPFALENQPLAMNNYGLGYNLVVLPFAILFGNTLQVYRSVTFAFILLAGLISFMIVNKTRQNPFLGLACSAFVMVGLIGNGGIGAFPSAMGTFLFLFAVSIPFFRSFDYPSLILSSLLSVLAFYTKPYFVLSFGIVASYLFLLVSKRKAVLFSLFSTSTLIISSVIVRKYFALYFIDTIAGNISNTSLSFGHLYSQLIQLFLYFYPLLVVILMTVCPLVFWEKKKKDSKPSGKIAIDFLTQDQPFIRYSVNYFFYVFICSFLAFIIILGPHRGSYLNYAYQLVVPSFCYWFFQKYNPASKTRIIFALLVIFNLYIWESAQLNPLMLNQRNSKAWAKLYSYITPSSNILNSPAITSKLVEDGITPLDSGQTQFFFEIKPYPDNKIIGPAYTTLNSNGIKYVTSINSIIRNQQFDLVFTTIPKVPYLIDSNVLKRRYSPFEQIQVDMPQTDEQWTIVIWKPLSK